MRMNTETRESTVNEQEVKKRVAALKRFKVLLEEQREKFRSYLSVLEQQQYSIMHEECDAMTEYTQMGDQIVGELFAMQKIIDPFEHISESAYDIAEEFEIPRLQVDLGKLQQKVVAQNKKNRELLEHHMLDLSARISAIQRQPYNKKNAVYAEANDSGTMIDFNL